ncbi:DUF1542 domain-containing protein, partial [Staphylococcus epidermidis]|uniref:DUF1542 domain-containing protein n=1 Tax=Staphylococcus epidermidis TaxID=1282 RepID=UPI00119CB9BE
KSEGRQGVENKGNEEINDIEKRGDASNEEKEEGIKRVSGELGRVEGEINGEDRREGVKNMKEDGISSLCGINGEVVEKEWGRNGI